MLQLLHIENIAVIEQADIEQMCIRDSGACAFWDARRV